MMTMVAAPSSPSFPDNNYNGPLAPASFKAMRTPTPSFPTDEGHSPSPGLI